MVADVVGGQLQAIVALNSAAGKSGDHSVRRSMRLDNTNGSVPIALLDVPRQIVRAATLSATVSRSIRPTNRSKRPRVTRRTRPTSMVAARGHVLAKVLAAVLAEALVHLLLQSFVNEAGVVVRNCSSRRFPGPRIPTGYASTDVP